MAASEKNESQREERVREIHKYVLDAGSVRVGSLSKQFGVTDETIRRDLDHLASMGLVRRTHGGAVAPGSTLTEDPYQVRSKEYRREKSEIAKLVAKELVPRGSAVALDAGSTTLEIARALRGMQVTIVTNSLPIISELTGSDCTVISVGGTARARSLSLVGPLAELGAAHFFYDVAFITAPGITPEHGPMDADLEEIAVKQCFVRQARSTYIPVDHSKLGRTSFASICRTEDLTGIVTDSGASDADLAPYEEFGLDIYRCGPLKRCPEPSEENEGAMHNER